MLAHYFGGAKRQAEAEGCAKRPLSSYGGANALSAATVARSALGSALSHSALVSSEVKAVADTTHSLDSG